MKKKVTALLFITLQLLLYALPSFAWPRAKHDKMMEKILFDEAGLPVNMSDESINALEAIETAAYLCIDQHNAPKDSVNDSDDAVKLNSIIDRHAIRWRLYRLPSKISDINFGGNDHRKYTHKGWNFDYSKFGLDKSHWATRKKILLSTVSFECGFTYYSIFGINSGYDMQCNAFCALIYYIHLLGDHEKAIIECQQSITKNGEYKKYAESEEMMHVADIVCELVELGDQLFLNSLNVWNNGMKEELRQIHDRLLNMGTIFSSKEKFEQYTSCFSELLTILQRDDYTSDFLKKEPFFSTTFYGTNPH